jgi:ligand-binding SRPBCC domain-containing protein
MRLRFLTTPPAEVRPGLLLTYRVRPMFAASVTWVTEITDVEAPARFSDRQRRGPFAMWEHEHRFRAVPGGVEVLDEIRYALPFGPLGTWAQPTLVAPQFAQLFAFRRATLAARFGVLT